MVRKNPAKKTALCGVFGGLAVVLLSLGGVIPAATFCAPALAGLCTVPVAVEFGNKAGLTVYAATGALSLFLCPNPEAVAIFVFLLGYYPLLKPKLDRQRKKVVRVLTKFGIFNLSMLLCYGLLLTLFPVAALKEEFSQMGQMLFLAFLILGNITFFVYDAALVNIFRVYLYRFRPRIFSGKNR